MEAILPHSTFSHYRIIEKLGAGGMGEVWLAFDERLKRRVALKLLLADLTADADRVRRFEQEAQAASALNHPNIITVYDIGESEAGRFIVMELVAGQTLRRVIAADNSPATLLGLAPQMAKALSAAHAAGITHRDIKPDNIMVRDDGYVKVLDFGLARLLYSNASDPEAATLAQQTMPGTIMGTVAYMSPEQARGEVVSPPSDIFALGIVLYELATGRHPFKAETLVGYLHAITLQEPAPPQQWQPKLPVALNELLLRMLAKDARQRPTADAVAQQLQAIERDAATWRQGDAGQGREDATLLLASPFVPSAPLTLIRHTVGRESERNELRAAFNAANTGRGSLLCVAGEPGIGKTTLVEDFLTELTTKNQCTIARGRCSERLAGAEAYLPLLEALESLLQRDKRLATTMKQLAPTWYAQVMPLVGDSEASMRLLAEVQATSQERMKRELAAFLQAVATPQPLVIFFDDLHWADVSTIDLLSFLAGKFDALRVLIVTTYRPSDMLLAKHPFLQIKPDLQARGLCRELLLEFLTEAEVTDYLSLKFPHHTFPPDFAKLIHTKTEGSPLFMADLVRYLRDRSVIGQSSGAWKLEQTLPDIERDLPESVRGMIERKIAQLSEADRQLLTCASVQGYEFDSAAVAQVLKLEADEVEERLEKLERVFAFVKLVSEGEFPNGTLTLKYRFVHILYQHVFQTSLRVTRRVAWCTALADLLHEFHLRRPEPIASVLANLREMARDWRQAAECFLLAARHAARIYADTETAALAQRGLANLNHLPPSIERSRLELRLQTTLGAALMTIHSYASGMVKQVYLRAEELCRELVDQRQLFRVQFGLSIICAVRGEFARARSLGEECLQLAEQTGDEELLAQAHWACGLSLQYPGDYANCRAHLQAAVALGEATRDAAGVSAQKQIAAVFSQGHLAVLQLYMGWPEQAEALKQVMLQRQQTFTHPLSVADNLYQAAFLAVFHRRIADVRACGENVLQYAETHGLKWYSGIGLMLCGWAGVKNGSAEEGLAQLREGLRAYRATETELSLTFYFALLADAYQATGQHKLGLEALTEGRAIAERTGERYFAAELYRLEGELLLQEAVLTGSALAEACFEQAIQFSRQQAAKALELRATMSLARLWQRQGKSAEARQLLVEIYGWFTEGFDTADLQEAKALLEELQISGGTIYEQ